ncbi:MAG: trypsin-like serine protease [Hydrogenophaga sp.]|nr:trypsin-like serine protease [Hydrogenophaga sp.]
MWQVVLAVGTVVWTLTGCGGGGGDSAPSAEALCNSIGTQPKIYNGTACGQPEAASVILLQVATSSSVSICSGTLITPNKVLTAAHCLANGAGQVMAGAWSPDGSVVGIPASGWAVHPGFQRTPTALVNDAAVVTLSAPLSNNTMGLLVSAPSASGQQVFIAGWGAPAFGLMVGAATLGLVNDTSVGYSFSGGGANTCAGDSGGPAFRSVGGRSGIVGITSSGSATDCGANDQSLFTNTQSASVLDFIRSQAPEAAYF